jgi:hypothetical protein
MAMGSPFRDATYGWITAGVLAAANGASVIGAGSGSGPAGSFWAASQAGQMWNNVPVQQTMYSKHSKSWPHSQQTALHIAALRTAGLAPSHCSMMVLEIRSARKSECGPEETFPPGTASPGS